MICDKYDLNWPCGSGKEYVYKFHQSQFSSSLVSIWPRPSFVDTLIPFTKESFVSILVWIGPVVLEKKMKIWNIYRQTGGQADIRRSSIKLTGAFSSIEPIKTPDKGTFHRYFISLSYKTSNQNTYYIVLRVVTLYTYCVASSIVYNKSVFSFGSISKYFDIGYARDKENAHIV